MMPHLQHGSIDLFFKGTFPQKQFTNVYFYVEGEFGFIPLIVGKSIEGDGTHMADILSPYLNVESFNRIPNINSPAWRMTAVKDDTIFIAITNWFPNSDGRGEPNPDLWKNSYPIMRDLLMFLKKHTCERVTFLTSMNILDNEKEPQLLMSNQLSEGDEMYLALPAWSYTHLAELMGMESEVMCVTQDEGLFIDPQALGMVVAHFVYEEFPFDTDKMDNTIQTLKGLEDQLNEQAFDEDSTMGEWV